MPPYEQACQHEPRIPYTERIMSMKAVTHLANNLLQISLIIISFTGIRTPSEDSSTSTAPRGRQGERSHTLYTVPSSHISSSRYYSSLTAPALY